ncbi:MAG: hypothetical protein AAFQ58_19205 [Pseudomonadota bacterium]
MIDLLDVIEVPDSVATLKGNDDGEDVLRDFAAIDLSHPGFFLFVAQMMGVGQPLADGQTDPAINEGKRIAALELLAILKLAKEVNYGPDVD